jgi:hypothetical protein
MNTILKIGSTIVYCTHSFKVVAFTKEGVVISNHQRTITITREQALACSN